MKKLLILSLVLIGFFSANGQTFEDIFLVRDFMQYKGASFKLKDQLLLKPRNCIYPDVKSIGKHVAYPVKTDKTETDIEKLKNRIFKVEDIVDKKGKPYVFDPSITYYPGEKEPVLVLNDVATNEKLYYVYSPDPGLKLGFPFLVSGVIFDPAVLCPKIVRRPDEISGEVRLLTPKYGEPVAIQKVIGKDGTRYYLDLGATGSSVTVDGKGVIVLFTDGSKWEKPDETIDVKAGSGDFSYSAFITLNDADLTEFSTKKIKKYRLYAYDNNMDGAEAAKFMIYTKCIMDAK